ncbi:MAG: DNA repair protein RecN [Alicyclobacillaceae bacterium]|nr:DNA repair protein RecN [Alicyclobacillaceae bacterium]
MLTALTVERIALLESVHVELNAGLLVFTGETGAGKSLLLDAIGLLLGGRASADWVRTGADSGRVEALFHVRRETRERLGPWLAASGLPDNGEELLLSREVHRSGRSVCRINGRMATVQMLRECGQHLIQQHGQNEQLGLLRADEQLRLLDLYAGHGELVQRVQRAYDEWAAARRQLDQTWMDEQERMRRVDVLRFQIEEIERADLKPGEEEALREERLRLQHVDKIVRALETAAAALEGRDHQPGATDQLASAEQELSAALAFDTGLEEVASLLATAQVHAEEAARALRRRLREVDVDPWRLEAIENRLADIRALQRKYGPTVEAVLAHLARCREELQQLLHHEEHMAQLAAAVEQAEARLGRLCGQLHESRRKAALRLATEVERTLRELNMPNAVFRIDVRSRRAAEVAGGTEPSAERSLDVGENSGEEGRADGQQSGVAARFRRDGWDDIIFQFSANKGEPPRPLQKVASGGELSRALLALKVALAEVDDVDTLVFDEVDAGVSGVAAQRLAELLRRLGRRRQVLCVTHSAQVAAAGDVHFCIEKVEGDARAQTQLKALDESGRVQEIARLIGSSGSDRTALDHARALLDRFREHGAAGAGGMFCAT